MKRTASQSSKPASIPHQNEPGSKTVTSHNNSNGHRKSRPRKTSKTNLNPKLKINYPPEETMFDLKTINRQTPSSKIDMTKFSRGIKKQ
jgi:hypothetical protein